MRRFFGWIVTLAIIAIVTLFAVNNRAPVGVELWPLPWAPNIPLFLLTLLLILFGFLFGVVVMWFTGAKRRRQLRAAKRELEDARIELHTLRRRPPEVRATGTAVATTQTRLPPAA
ncbi:MAG TPA: lipopolysaccharide assembly protein LapA domain-containing protein [Candidatus Cybelea sp.]|nr:lipopolysaccharide assembly protein LapA domain-containing protein [Candidatus Cybelea sp.]